MARNYWLDLFSGATWDQFRQAGSKVSGFRESRWKTVQRITVGDYLICYLTGVSRFIGILEVVSRPYKDSSGSIWKDDEFPCRMEVKPIVELDPLYAVPVHSLRDELSFFRNLKSLHAWTGRFRSSPTKWKASDGEAVVKALREAQDNPVERPFDKRKLKYRPRALKTNIGLVTIPDSDQEETDLESNGTETKRSSEHTEVQWQLLKLGSDMGFDIWVARNDRGRSYDGKAIGSIPRLKSELPLQFDEQTNRTIELIDVLWLQGNAIVAAFEIESTTSIYSGLLRMADLIAMQPNLNIPLYLVAPDSRREKVMTEVNRPTFSRLNPPLWEICRYISFSGLRGQIKEAQAYIRYLKPEFLDELSESCELEEG